MSWGLAGATALREGKPRLFVLNFQSVCQLLSNRERPSSDGRQSVGFGIPLEVPVGNLRELFPSPQAWREQDEPVLMRKESGGLSGVGRVTPVPALLGTDLVRKAATEACREECGCGLLPPHIT